MTDLKKIAADIRDEAAVADRLKQRQRLEAIAAALDALAAQSEPVAWFRWTDMDGYERITSGRPSVEHVHPDSAVVPFTPQPAPPQPAVPEEFEKALFRFVDQHARAIAPAASGEWTTDEEYAAAKAEVLRLYASAAPQPAGEPSTGSWIAADDVLRLTKKLDVALNGQQQGMATRPELCDVVGQACAEARKRGAPLLSPQRPTVKYIDIISALESSWEQSDRIKALRSIGIEVMP